MMNPTIYNVSERPRYVFKKPPFISQVDDPLGAFLQVLENFLHVEDIRLYIHCKFERIGDNDIHKDLELVCWGDFSLKQEFMHLKELNIVNHMFFTKFDSHE